MRICSGSGETSPVARTSGGSRDSGNGPYNRRYRSPESGRSALVRATVELDPEQFWRVHRNTIVRVAAIEAARRDVMGRVNLAMKGMREPVAVSRAYAHLFRQR